MVIAFLFSCNVIKKNTHTTSNISENILICSEPYQYSENNPELFKKRYYKFYIDGTYKTGSFDTKINGGIDIELNYDQTGKYEIKNEVIFISLFDTIEVVNLNQQVQKPEFAQYFTEYQIQLVDSNPIFLYRRNPIEVKGNLMWIEQKFNYCD
jgi:hypothetical protein